jgi:hypothetical protein
MTRLAGGRLGQHRFCWAPTAFADVAMVNAAVVMEQAVRANPVITSDDRGALLALAEALTGAQAKATGSQ